jgi:hypothetical protein
VAPGAIFYAPRPNTRVRTLQILKGVANDNPSGVGLESFVISIRRDRDNRFWNGTGWVAQTNVSLTPTFTGAFWTYRSGPTQLDLEDGGVYVITGLAIDRAGNRTIIRAVVRADVVAPTVTITTPANGARLPALPEARGTATDTTVGSGVEQVVLGLKRVDDSRYWSGRNWSRTPVTFRARLTGTNWINLDALPSGLNLKPGAYYLTAVAIDRVANRRATTVYFRILPATPTPTPTTTPTATATPTATPTATATPAATRSVSTASVDASRGVVTLKLRGALDSALATDPAQYEVTVNGRVVEVESVSYSAATNTVLLALPEGTVQSGARVLVSGLVGAGPLTAR